MESSDSLCTGKRVSMRLNTDIEGSFQLPSLPVIEEDVVVFVPIE